MSKFDRKDLPLHVTKLSSQVIDDDFFTADQARLLKEVGLKEFTELLKEKAIKISLEENNGKSSRGAKQIEV